MSKIQNKYMNMPAPIKASFWFLIATVIQKGISVITTPIFTRLLSPAQFGEYNIFNSWMNVIGVFVTLRLSFGVYNQGIVKYENARDEFSSSMQGLSLTVNLISLTIYLLFSKFWNQLFGLNTLEMISMFLILWSDAVYDFWATSERVDYKYKRIVQLTVIVSIMKPLLGILAVQNFDAKVTARIVSIAVVNMFAYSYLFYYQLKKGGRFFWKEIWKYALCFNLPLIPHYLSQTVLNSADRIMIGKMIGDSAAGIYGLAYSLALLMTIVNSSIMQTMSPWIFKKIRDRKVADIEKISYLSLVFVAAVNLLVIAFTPELIKIFAPASYGAAIWVVPPVAMSVPLMFAYDLFAKFQFYYEKTRLIMAASLCGSILNIILNYIFIPVFGFLTAGYTTLFCYLSFDIAHYYFMSKTCDEFLDGIRPFQLKMLLLIFVAFSMLSFILMGTYNYPILRFTFLVSVFILIMIKRNNIKKLIYALLDIKNPGNVKE